MNLTQKLKQHIVQEFKRGRSMSENDRVFMLKLGTTERLAREALKAQDGAVVHEDLLTTPKDG